MAVRLLVIDTATPNLTVALFDGDVLIAHRHDAVGRGHAELLIPTIAALPDGGRADSIWVGCGPGSFTGLRIGIAAARALAFAWGSDLRGFNTLALIAAQARRRAGLAPVGVAVDGGHGEWLVADLEGPDAPSGQSLPPVDAAQCLTSTYVAGQRAAELVRLRGWGTAMDAESDAREAMGLLASELFDHVSPIYARAPDAAPAKVRT